MFRFRFYSVAALLILLAAAHLVYWSNRGKRPRPLPGETVILQLSLAPAGWLAWPFHMVGRVWDRYVTLIGAARENEDLHRRLAQIELELHRLKEVELTHDRLKGLLGFKESLPLDVVGAEVLSRTADGVADVVYLGAGEGDGVRPPAAVVAASGLIGRVVTASHSFSKVLPLTDASSAVGAVTQRTRVQGVVKGVGRNRCRLEHVPLNADVVVGDSLVTSGLDGIYPRALMIGMISRVERPAGSFFAEVEVVPATRLSQVEEVLVVIQRSAEPLPEQEP